MRIAVVKGTGAGPTAVAAFDSALQAAGLAGFNLIRLSSTVPPGWHVEREPTDRVRDRVKARAGQRLYCVYGECRADKDGEEAWTGIGWWLAPGCEGIFVEHSACSRAKVEEGIRVSIEHILGSRGWDVSRGEMDLEVCAVQSDGKPACGLVVAAYGSEAWDASGVTEI